MEYFLLKQSSEVINPIKILGDGRGPYTIEMTHQDFKKLPKACVGYIDYDPSCEMPDILTYPTYMVTDPIKRVMKLYDEAISFKAMQVYPQIKEQVKEGSKTYWVYDCVVEKCLHSDSIILPNGEIQRLILDRKKMKGRDIFRVDKMIDNKLIISLAVAESILRRNVYGVELSPVEIK